MKTIKFTKMVAAGNDFVVVEGNIPQPRKSAVKMCHRTSGIGADGMLLLSKGGKADVRMRVFNADGSEAEMCGNGARCACLYWAARTGKNNVAISTAAGRVSGRVNGSMVRIRLTEPRRLRMDIPIRLGQRGIKVNYIDTGVPHAVVFVEGLDKIDVPAIGRQIRYHGRFSPGGANADFVEVASKDRINIRTYERGVENETLACGTGAAASAIVTSIKLQGSDGRKKISVLTRGKEELKVYFNKTGGSISDVWLEGAVRVVYGGEYYV
ncbi:MAG: diaminopimelate epimerase [Candidatus Omnitrophica bacterium]|nr:diaminopimelate epimerase [Candidatus Omnitrophota bacterium]